ncbi:hypothetical protein M5K25_008227 [Dendrobium thyrsiflorum]|uniref:DUF4283 domain-containing protein n=1 Tax=Dendrobium thyrsiflorum TaxID=117978 RepID=A0ABD0V856_DENTH
MWRIRIRLQTPLLSETKSLPLPEHSKSHAQVTGGDSSCWILSASGHGDFPVAISNTVHPRDHTSSATHCSSPRITSGAMNTGVAITDRPPSPTLLAQPKSSSLTMASEQRRTFLPLTSQWAMSFEWRRPARSERVLPSASSRKRLRPKQEEFTKIQLWIKLLDLPLVCWTPEGISKIFLFAVDSLTVEQMRLTFARVCVLINKDFCLPEEVNISIAGNIILIKVAYNWKPTPCQSCGSIVHSSSLCPSKPKAEGEKQATIMKPLRGRSKSKKQWKENFVAKKTMQTSSNPLISESNLADFSNSKTMLEADTILIGNCSIKNLIQNSEILNVLDCTENMVSSFSKGEFLNLNIPSVEISSNDNNIFDIPTILDIPKLSVLNSLNGESIDPKEDVNNFKHDVSSFVSGTILNSSGVVMEQSSFKVPLNTSKTTSQEGIFFKLETLMSFPNIISWNVRGFNCLDKVKAFSDMVSNFMLNFVVFLKLK